MVSTEQFDEITESWRPDLTELVRSIIAEIEDDYRAPGCEDDDEPSMQLTVATDDELAEWSYQTGDNSFAGGAYAEPYWAVVTLTRDVDVSSIVDDIFQQWRDLLLL